jgi:hypothetical protein
MRNINKLILKTVNNNSTEFEELNMKILKLNQDQKRVDQTRVD